MALIKAACMMSAHALDPCRWACVPVSVLRFHGFLDCKSVAHVNCSRLVGPTLATLTNTRQSVVLSLKTFCSATCLQHDEKALQTFSSQSQTIAGQEATATCAGVAAQVGIRQENDIRKLEQKNII